jgi:hypothetical protein
MATDYTEMTNGQLLQERKFVVMQMQAGASHPDGGDWNENLAAIDEELTCRGYGSKTFR